MRKLINTPFKGGEVSYFDMICQLLTRPSDVNAGSNYEEMLEVVEIHGKLKDTESGDHILLEEEEYKTVATRVRIGPYTLNTEEVLDMIKSVLSAEKVKVEEA